MSLCLSGKLRGKMCLGRVLYSKTICAAYVHGGKACPKRALADTLKEDSAGNIVALGYHIW
eukprot:288102-Pelagomonas_calceolata.AAC.1